MTLTSWWVVVVVNGYHSSIQLETIEVSNWKQLRYPILETIEVSDWKLFKFPTELCKFPWEIINVSNLKLYRVSHYHRSGAPDFIPTTYKGCAIKNVMFQNLICNFLVNCWSQEAVLLRTWSTH